VLNNEQSKEMEPLKHLKDVEANISLRSTYAVEMPSLKHFKHLCTN
jgi:hypothetical protein